MKSKRRFIPLVFLGAIIMSLLLIVPAFSATGAVRFYDVNDTDEDQEWTRQGGMVYIEVEDSDLDEDVALSGDSAESHELSGGTTIWLNNVPVADSRGPNSSSPDGFVNANDVTVVDADGKNLEVDRASPDGRVDLTQPHTGMVMVAYTGAAVNMTESEAGDGAVTVKSQADPSGFVVVLTEDKSDSGIFRGSIETNADNSVDGVSLKVGKNDVITVSYNEEDPDRTTSKTLKVETTAPVISNPSPAHNSADRADPDIQFDVTDADSGIADEDDIWVIFAVDSNADGKIESEHEYQVDEASKGDVDEEDGIFSAKQGLPGDVAVDDDATVYWWALARDAAGNVSITDRSSTIKDADGKDVDDPVACSESSFPRGGLTDKDVTVTQEIGGCQPYAVRIDNTEPSAESAKTGPTWDADDDEVDQDAGDASSVLVVFSESLDADTVEASDFTVEGASVTDVEVQGKNVFLTLSADLDPDDEPNVELVGSVRDIAGNRQTSGKLGADDGIAPTLTVMVEGGNRSVTNGDITITISSNEDVGTPEVTFSKVVNYDKGDDASTEDHDEAMDALEEAAVKVAVLQSNRNYEVSWKATEGPGLYNVYVTANDATSSNTGKAGVNKGPIDLDEDTKAILFEYDDSVGKPTVTPEKTDNSDPFISINFSAEGSEYMDEDTAKLDSHGTVTVTAATLDSDGMDEMDIADMLVTTNNVVFLYKASDLAKGDYTITVSATDAAGNKLEDEELSLEVIEREPFELELKPGWNLVSLPGNPTNSSLNAVIPADHPASTILSYDAESGWTTAIRSEDGTWLGTLMTVDASRAYWIQTDTFDSIKVDIPRIGAGTSVPPTISLMAGWNFIPVVDVSGEMNYGDEISANGYFSGTDVNRVYSFDTIQGMWEVVDLADKTSTLMVGSGYWAHSTDDGVIAP